MIYSTSDEFPSFELRRGICWMTEHISPSQGTLLHFIRDKIHHIKKTREPCKSYWRNSYTVLNIVSKTHTCTHTCTRRQIHKEQLINKRHKANKSWERWFRRQKGTSRMVILCDCSLLCTSKWRITVTVGRMAASSPELNRHIFLSLNNDRGLDPKKTEHVGWWVVTLFFWSEGQRSVWVKGHPRVHSGDGC